ncbi:MAG: M3 family oligoendopeptidase [Candidatus Sumerlaeia bacterium]|nr:M3 family oligoendopeptidase [Candidatus Sumerlaeia bacterium]
MTSALRDPVDIPRPGEFPRQFVPAQIDLGDWAQIEPLFDALAARGLDSAEALEHWLLDLSELGACLSEERARRHIASTCFTDDAEAEARHMHFVTEIVPRIKPRVDALHRRYLASPWRGHLDRQRLLVHDRDVENAVALYREENVPLQTEEQRLENEHYKVTGAQTVEFRGAIQTMPQMMRHLEETDALTRREAWVAMTQRRLQDAETLSTLFDQMLTLRHQMALNAGFENFRDYQHRRLGRFDYTPADCEAFHAAVETTCVPLARELAAQRQHLLGLEALRPWDLAVDPLGRPPLRPFATAEELVTGCRRVFRQVSPMLAEDFDVLTSRRLLDLESRPAKAPGGYQSTLDEVRLPFIFMNAAGTNRDVFTLLHEGGHAFHALASRHEPLLAYRDAPLEFCEVASMGMEMMALDGLGEFYTEADAARARRRHLESVIKLFPWIAQIDAFQHWLYTHAGHTRGAREEVWLGLEDRLGIPLDWSGHEVWKAISWQSQLHLFQAPFYYIEYGIAQIGALQLWLNHRRDAPGAIAKYREALALGGSRPLPRLFATAGLRFDFSAETMRPLIEAVREELERLPD